MTGTTQNGLAERTLVSASPASGDIGIDTPAIARLRSWIVSANRRATPINLDTDLIGEGALDSLQMVNFIMYVEEIRGRDIPEALIQAKYFTSLRLIYDTFFRP